MPTYQYRCNECGYEFELFQAMTAAPVTTCPECHGPVRRLIGGGSAILFKGAGRHAPDGGQSHGPACGRDVPCCGREVPCDRRPCDS